MSAAAWADRLIALSSGPLPVYGSPEWDALAEHDLRKLASAIRAAECWRQDGEPDALRERLAAEIEFNDSFTAWRLRAMSNDLASDAEHWQAASRRVSWAELQRQREYEGVTGG